MLKRMKRRGEGALLLYQIYDGIHYQSDALIAVSILVHKKQTYTWGLAPLKGKLRFDSAIIMD